MRKLDVCLAAVLTLAGCSTLSPRRDPDEKRIEIITSGAPKRHFVKVGKLDFHVEKWSKDDPSIEDFRPELERKARSVGADAVMDLDWTLKGTAELGVYHVKATAITYPVAGEHADGAPGEHAEAPLFETREIEILQAPPARPYTKVSNLDLYIEKKSVGEGSLDDVLPELKQQARLSGAHAVMDVQWTLRRAGEAGAYHVTATGIAYSDGADKPAPAEAK